MSVITFTLSTQTARAAVTKFLEAMKSARPNGIFSLQIETNIDRRHLDIGEMPIRQIEKDEAFTSFLNECNKAVLKIIRIKLTDQNRNEYRYQPGDGHDRIVILIRCRAMQTKDLMRQCEVINEEFKDAGMSPLITRKKSDSRLDKASAVLLCLGVMLLVVCAVFAGLTLIAQKPMLNPHRVVADIFLALFLGAVLLGLLLEIGEMKAANIATGWVWIISVILLAGGLLILLFWADDSNTAKPFGGRWHLVVKDSTTGFELVNHQVVLTSKKDTDNYYGYSNFDEGHPEDEHRASAVEVTSLQGAEEEPTISLRLFPDLTKIPPLPLEAHTTGTLTTRKGAPFEILLERP